MQCMPVNDCQSVQVAKQTACAVLKLLKPLKVLDIMVLIAVLTSVERI